MATHTPGSAGVSVGEVLEAFGSPFHEDQLWALCAGTAAALTDQPRIVTPHCLLLVPQNGRVHVQMMCKADDDQQRFLPTGTLQSDTADGASIVFSLGATLFFSADYMLDAEEEPVLSKELELLLAAMTDEDASDRCTLEEVTTVWHMEYKNAGCEMRRAEGER